MCLPLIPTYNLHPESGRAAWDGKVAWADVVVFPPSRQLVEISHSAKRATQWPRVRLCTLRLLRSALSMGSCLRHHKGSPGQVSCLTHKVSRTLLVSTDPGPLGEGSFPEPLEWG